MKRVIKTLLHIALTIGAILFVNYTEIISQFLDGKTTYASSHEPLTLHDLPALTICWDAPVSLDWFGFTVLHKRVYGQDLLIELRVIEGKEQNVILKRKQ